MGMRVSRGFLLLEVVVSMVVLTAGLMFVTQAFSASQKTVQRSQALLAASFLLEERMFEFEEQGEIEERTLSGMFNVPQGLSWQIQAVPMGLLNLNAVTVTVFKKEAPQGGYVLQACLNGAAIKGLTP